MDLVTGVEILNEAVCVPFTLKPFGQAWMIFSSSWCDVDFSVIFSVPSGSIKRTDYTCIYTGVNLSPLIDLGYP